MFASHLVGPAAQLRHTMFLAEVHHEGQLALAVDGLASSRRRSGWAMALHAALRTMQSLPAGRIRLAAARRSALVLWQRGRQVAPPVIAGSEATTRKECLMYPCLSTIDMAAVYQRDLLTTAGVASPSSRENNDARGRATFCQSNSYGDTRPRGPGRVPAARARDFVLLVTLVALVLAALGAGLIPVAPHLGSPDAWFL
jgi:hypothetical protein